MLCCLSLEQILASVPHTPGDKTRPLFRTFSLRPHNERSIKRSNIQTPGSSENYILSIIEL